MHTLAIISLAAGLVGCCETGNDIVRMSKDLMEGKVCDPSVGCDPSLGTEPKSTNKSGVDIMFENYEQHKGF